MREIQPVRRLGRPGEPDDVASARPVARSGDGPVLVPVPDAWESGASCRSHDPVLFFGPNRFEPKRERQTREDAAKAICAGCPALAVCRERALAEAELYGVWGGLGESDRRAILAARDGGQVARSA